MTFHEERCRMSGALAIDLFCGLGGWTDGLLAEGYYVVGFDIERHQYWGPEDVADGDGSKGTKPIEKRGWTQGCAVSLGVEGANARPRTKLYQYPAQLVIQDVLTLHGSQFKDAALIVASPPCQAYSYRAMPWKRAKALPPPDNTLFESCFRIQREACEAAGRHIPLIVENVRGAQKWVGRARWNYGSFYLWGDVPALMPRTLRDPKMKGRSLSKGLPQEMKWGGHNVSPAHADAGQYGHGRKAPAGTQWFNDGPRTKDSLASMGGKSPARKFASAMIAKIPLPLSRHIAATFYPRDEVMAA